MNAAAHMSTLYPLLPEIVLGLGAMALLMLGAYGDARTARIIDGLAIALLIAAGVILYLLPTGKLVSFNGSFVVDNFARFLKILALAGSAAAIAMSLDYAKHERQQRFEYSVLIVLSTLGMMMLISAADLIALYLGLELMSLPLYVVAASHRDSLRSTEAGLKIFRARRAVVGDAALRRVAGLRIHRHRELCRHRASRRPWRHRADLRVGFSVRRLLLQGLRRAVPHVDAGRL